MHREQKSCNLLGNQKVFYLTKNEATSCCRAHGISLSDAKSFSGLTEIWNAQVQQLESGVEIESCEHCWKSEQQGIQSFRQQNLNIHKNSIEICASNLCNHMCSYCSPSSSSEWENSIQQHGKFTNVSRLVKEHQSFVSNTVDDFWMGEISTYIESQPVDSVHLRLIGGEPLMQSKNLEYICSFVDQLKMVEVHTNLNPPTNKFLLRLLETVPASKLHFFISIDAAPDYNHIPRAGFDSNRFNENLALLKQHNIDCVFTPVVSVLSVFGINDFINWYKEHEYPVRFSQIQNPDCLSVLSIPAEFREKIWNTIKHNGVGDFVTQLLTSTGQVNNLVLFEQYNYINQYFERAGIDPLTIDNKLLLDYLSFLEGKFK